MADKDEKFEDNVPGKYYVDTSCIACDACSVAAPDNFKLSEELEHAFVANNPPHRKKKKNVKRPLKVALSKPLAVMGTNKASRNQQIILKLLKEHYQSSRCVLSYKTPYQLLVATILSAQCTDQRVNQVTPALFKKYPDAQKMSQAHLKEIETLIRSTGFYKNKAKHILATSQEVVRQYKGQVPCTMEELSRLPGVGRKTANVVLGNAFGIPGIVVDTHVTRLSNRLGLASGLNAVKLEKDLERVVCREDWIDFSHWMIWHGRKLCKARKPLCGDCFLQHVCTFLT